MSRVGSGRGEGSARGKSERDSRIVKEELSVEFGGWNG